MHLRVLTTIPSLLSDQGTTLANKLNRFQTFRPNPGPSSVGIDTDEGPGLGRNIWNLFNLLASVAPQSL